MQPAAAELAERKQAAAIEAERKRVADEAALAKKQADDRAANVAHRSQRMKAAKDALIGDWTLMMSVIGGGMIK